MSMIARHHGLWYLYKCSAEEMAQWFDDTMQCSGNDRVIIIHKAVQWQ